MSFDRCSIRKRICFKSATWFVQDHANTACRFACTSHLAQACVELDAAHNPVTITREMPK